MRRRMQKELKSWTTIPIVHTYHWVRAESGDRVYSNPQFKVPANLPPSLRNGLVIYFIHGTGDNNGEISEFALRLLGRRLHPLISEVDCLEFDERFEGKSIDDFAKQIVNKIQCNGHRVVGFVGHSRGGLLDTLVAEVYAKTQGFSVPFIINLGTPYKGSGWAMKPITHFSASVKQMRTDSPFLKELAKKVADSKVNYHFFGADRDVIVKPENTYVRAYVDKHPESYIQVDETHMSLLQSKSVDVHCWHIINQECESLLEKALVKYTSIFSECEINIEATGELNEASIAIQADFEELETKDSISSLSL